MEDFVELTSQLSGNPETRVVNVSLCFDGLSFRRLFYFVAFDSRDLPTRRLTNIITGLRNRGGWIASYPTPITRPAD